MVHQLIGFYGDKEGYVPKNTDHLVLEIGKDQLVLMVKDPNNNCLEAIELFELEKDQSDWSDVFFEIKQKSDLLGFNYSSTKVFFNFEEALMMPLGKLGASASEEYLDLVYGTSDRSVVKYDLFQINVPFVTVYRIKQAILDLLNRNFLLFTAQHLYTGILNDVLGRAELPPVFLKLIVYCRHVILVLAKDGQLQLIQNYPYQTQEDVLYHCLNLVQQLGLLPMQTQIEMSGLLDLLPKLEDQLKQSFEMVSYDLLPLDSIASEGISTPQTIQFTPFYKLLV